MRASRPRMFGSVVEPVLLPWEWALDRLATSPQYWIATTRPDGRPHTRPVWGVLLDETPWFSTGSLAAGWITEGTPMTLHTESGQQVVILEGTATAATELEPICAAYNAKYAEQLTPDTLPGPFWGVRIEVAFGWMAAPTFVDGGSVFHGTATRWAP